MVLYYDFSEIKKRDLTRRLAVYCQNCLVFTYNSTLLDIVYI